MIREIINKKQIDIHFQPIVSIRTRDIYAFEALTRCKYNGQFIPPDVLFSLAKEQNLNIKLDEITRNLAIQKFHKYYLEDNRVSLFLNFESDLINNFEHSSKMNSFIETILKLNIPFKNFVLEIKEDEISNTNALEKFCVTYKNMGFSIALDDFGTGSSNFHRINLIRPDIIKIDRSLFLGVKRNHVNKEVVKAISKMSNNLGIRVLAEGVEDEDAISLGMKSLVNLYQGYYFSKPFDVDSSYNKNEIVEKMNTIGKIFKEKTISAINAKRESINKYDLIANEVINKLTDIKDSYETLKDEFSKYLDIEALYLIDTKSSRQLFDTLIDCKVTNRFNPTKDGDEHYLKEYYYITMESKNGIYLSQKYISYATGNICKTFAKKFKLSQSSFILCFDIVLEGS